MDKWQAMNSPFQDITPNRAINMFLFPFSFNRKEKKDLVSALYEHEFDFFSLENTDLEKKFYSKDYFVSHA
ncbi:hypothetical protein OSK03_28040, partial [Escherichia coli]|nr:hypothetical protein [Escherichia coli]